MTDVVVELAAAARDAKQNRRDGILEEAMESLRPTAMQIAQAYARSLTEDDPAAARMMLNARLQVVLMQEHVAAQRRMGRGMTVMTVAILILGGVQLIVGWPHDATLWIERVLRIGG